ERAVALAARAEHRAREAAALPVGRELDRRGDERAVLAVRQLPRHGLVLVRAALLREDRDPEVVVLRLARRQRDRADVDGEDRAVDLAAPALEGQRLPADLEGRVRRPAEGPVRDAARAVRARGARLARCRVTRREKRRHGGGSGGQSDPKGCPHLLASCICASSAVRTCWTCWLTIGWRTRWPIEPTGPAIFTSADHAIEVPPSGASPSVNDVSMFIIAPTPLPLTASFANSLSRSSTFSMSTFIFRPPRPSGILTFAVQRRSSWMSNDSTPGIVFAIDAGSFSTCHTV